MSFPRGSRMLVAMAVVALPAACATGIPPDALRLSPEAAANRELQTRRYDGIAERDMLDAGTGVLQDLGFTIDEADTSLGVIVAAKERSAVNEAEVAGAYLLTILSILAMSPSEPVYSKRQVIRVALVARPGHGSDDGSTLVRVTFQRAVFDNNERIRLVEQINEPMLYQDFFERLSRSVFLEAQSP